MNVRKPNPKGRGLTPRERQEARKRERLEMIETQIAEGKLRIRQMTDEERAARRVNMGTAVSR